MESCCSTKPLWLKLGDIHQYLDTYYKCIFHVPIVNLFSSPESSRNPTEVSDIKCFSITRRDEEGGDVSMQFACWVLAPERHLVLD